MSRKIHESPMSIFTNAFRRTLAQRQRDRFVEKIRVIAEQKLAEGEPTTKVAYFVGGHLGCPCCGPTWWRDLAIRAYKETGETLPPELAGVSG